VLMCDDEEKKHPIRRCRVTDFDHLGR
jgi:hypothetical protein